MFPSGGRGGSREPKRCPGGTFWGTRSARRLRNVAGDELPVRWLREHFAGVVYEGCVGRGVALEAVHHPGSGIAEIAVDADDARLLGVLAIWLAGDVVVSGTDKGALQFGDACRHGVVIGGDGLLPSDGCALVWR